jgi:oligopeptide/dipeptide ABC transporter ATP-binding protein
VSVLLEVTDLRTSFRTDDGVVTAVDGVSFRVEKGKTLGVVGESGCGKSVTFLSIMSLNDKRSATSTGSAVFDGVDLLSADDSTVRALRGQRLAMIFQDPMTSLNPVKRIGWQLEEAVLVHNDVSHSQARARALEVLEAVRIPRATQRIDDYPHQFSGGMRQRVMIAMGLINRPELLIADEPTTALDVTTQAQIIDLMKSLQRDLGMAIAMITHDLGVVAEMADDVLVMYGGQIIEQGKVDDVFYHPVHPYTWGLLGSLPRLDQETERLAQIPGQPPSLLRPPPGCRFAPRCPYVFDRCHTEAPRLAPAPEDEHLLRCHLDAESRDRHQAEVLGALATGGAA